MRAHSADFLSDVQARPDLPEAGVAHRAAGADLLACRRVSRCADHERWRSPWKSTRPRRRPGVPFRTGPRRLRNSVSCACFVASRRDRSRGVVHVADAGAYNVPHTWQHDRPRTHVRGSICIDAWRPHEGEGKFLGAFSNRQRARPRPVPRLRNVFRRMGEGRERLARRARWYAPWRRQLTRAEHPDF